MLNDKNQGEDRLSKWLPIGLAALSFVAGTAYKGLDFFSNVATKPYVDEGLKVTREISQKYTDDKVSNAVQILKDYSDQNRMRMEQSLTDKTAEIKSDLKSQSAKLDLVIDSIHVFDQRQAYEMGHGKKF